MDPASHVDRCPSITTRRLTLVAATAALVRAEMDDPPRFFRLLQVRPSTDWPPKDVRDALPFFREELRTRSELAGWLSWYWILRANSLTHTSGTVHRPCDKGPDSGVLIGGGGFKGPPDHGLVEIGYHVLAPYRRRGYAAEAVEALLGWAFSHSSVRAVVAETGPGNAPSRGLLEKLGFGPTGDVGMPGAVRYTLHRPSNARGGPESVGSGP